MLDSGASDHVGDGSAAPEIPVEPSPGSQRGLTYGCAGGKEIPNEGQQRLPLVTCSGNKAGLTFQVAEVSKNLASVSKVCDMGNRVIFGKGGGVIQNLHSGIITPVRRQGGIYILDLWLDRQQGRNGPFPRQGRR